MPDMIWLRIHYCLCNRVEFLHVIFFNADSDPDGQSNEAYGAMEDSSHRCGSDSRLSPHHWIDYIFFMPW